MMATVANAQYDDDAADDDMADDDAADDDAADDDATADDDSAGFENSSLHFTSPDNMLAEVTYKFDLTVNNASMYVEGEGKTGEWIYQFDLSMPSKEFQVDESQLTAPDPPLHGSPAEGEYQILRWESNFDSSSATITWQCFGVVTSANYGDIREGEALSFQFVATTDSGDGQEPTDGFPWKLYGDLGSIVEGVAWINDPNQDDDTGDDDDDDIHQDDDDSNGGGGCGC